MFPSTKQSETGITRRRPGVPKPTIITTLLWLSLVSLSMYRLCAYGQRPGSQQSMGNWWPKESRLTLSQLRPTLLIFAHPRCPCSRASFRQLERLLTPLHGQVDSVSVFCVPEQASAEWLQTDLVMFAGQLPDMEIRFDEGGTECQRFGAMTSGLVMLFSPAGELLFQGGITASRGHEGDNASSAALAALINGSPAAVDRMPVYGCPLHAPDPTVESRN